jgi:hypothetical protein
VARGLLDFGRDRQFELSAVGDTSEMIGAGDPAQFKRAAAIA